ncbi:hypothetical protein [Lichenicoccus sp.]|uniref:hypothetical protein n=1 Tax=Lichenicoccus sp. TaxID=2781899 RepID=UPI003D0A556E
MTHIIDLAPHDPLPDGPALVLLRRFEEDDPRRIMIEIVALDSHHTESNARLTDDHGRPMSWEDATAHAMRTATDARFEALYRIDRLAGPRETEIVSHNGDHATNMENLEDFDPEDGEPGTDMRDRGNSGAPRRF